MDRSLYIAMSGAKQNMTAQAIHSHNLANASTVGFRADYEQARSMPVYGDTHPVHVYSLTENPGTDFSSGGLISTGADLDIAVEGEGWIAVQDAEGQESYTRAGDLRLTSTGELLTSAGYAVLGNGGPVVIPPFEKLEIGSDGTISIRAAGQSPALLAEVNRIKLVKPDLTEIQKGVNGLFRKKDESIEPVSAEVTIIQGYLEDSNVNPVESLTKILSLARQFDLQIKVMKEVKQNDAAAARLMHVSIS
ncbi:MAG: flagellar basal-body rod protein FlgF [Gammaproteobacteria bacterium]|nr:MAG: flagellar basal-body rod protein FlgF [Gammaproteobacteria bacterium]